MCGIAGIFRRRIPTESDPSRLRAMTDIMAHRGPDDFGYLLLDSRNGDFQIGQAGFTPGPYDVSMGHRRLAIIDLSPSGRQPISNETSDIFAVFNGEIFNYLELRGELAAKGHVFRSQTDTEVIVHAYEEWGPDCVSRFNGMWALALWDQRKRELFCSRDRFGIKPFYYHLDDEVFLFASEIKGILVALDTRPRANYSVLGNYLLDASLCHTPDTFFEGIKSLESSHNLLVSSAGVRTHRYWDYHTQSQAYDDHRPVETFHDLLDDAVKLRLRSDVPVGIALSGGLDSTSLLACAARWTDAHNLTAFTVVFPGEPFDESEYAQLACHEIGAELLRIEYQPERFMEDLRCVTWSLDYPALDAQVLPRWRLMRLASRHVKVILEGQGADEMLAGYVTRYFGTYLVDELARMKSGRRLPTLKKLLASTREMYRQHGGAVYLGLLRRLAPEALLRRNFLRRCERALARNRVYSREFSDLCGSPAEAPRAPEFEDRLTDLMHYDHSTWILPRLLKFGDALSMASSLESRVPFLDHRLVEFVFRLPVHHKLNGAVSKGILRDAMTGAIPERILSRKDKIGFRTPLSRWILDAMDSGVRPLLTSSRSKERGIFDLKKVERILAQHAEGGADAARSIFQWVSVELWFRLFIDGEGLPAD